MVQLHRDYRDAACDPDERLLRVRAGTQRVRHRTDQNLDSQSLRGQSTQGQSVQNDFQQDRELGQIPV